MSTEEFEFKGHRQSVVSNLETLVSRNISNTLETAIPTLPETNQHRDSAKVETNFGAFLQYLNAQQLIFDNTGRSQLKLSECFLYHQLCTIG